MNIEQVLSELGLQDKEPIVYLTLLKTHGAQPASIIATRADLNRTTVYKSLIKLTKIGLVTKTMKHGIICFFAEDPEDRLKSLLSKKKKHIDYISDLFIKILPDIKGLERKELYVPKMRYYEGREGVERVYFDTLIEKQPIYSFIATRKIPDDLLSFLEDEYLPQRIEDKIFAYVITPETIENKKFKKGDKKSYRETRFLTINAPDVAKEININGKKTAFVSHKTNEQFGIILESKSITLSMKGLFDICWMSSKK